MEARSPRLGHLQTESLGEGVPPSVHLFSEIPPLASLLLKKKWLLDSGVVKALPHSFGKQQEQNFGACKYQWRERKAALYGHTN